MSGILRPELRPSIEPKALIPDACVSCYLKGTTTTSKIQLLIEGSFLAGSKINTQSWRIPQQDSSIP